MNEKKTRSDPGQDLLAAHRELMREVGQLRQWWEELDELGSPRFGEMGDRIEHLRDILAAHFEDEEQGGYLSAALAAAPRFSEQANELKQQHVEMLHALDEFIAALSSAEPPFQGWQEARRQFEHFLARLRAHEAAENAIVQSAFGDDVGQGD